MDQMNTESQNENKMHPFERTLGQGPYKFVGFFGINIQAGQAGRPYFDKSMVHPRFVRGCGTCAHCGHAILNIYQVQIGNGDVFGVGSDCIHAVGLPARELSAIKRIELKHQREMRLARKKVKGDKARLELGQLIQSQKETLKNILNPRGRGNLLAYAVYCHTRSNDGGIVIALKVVKHMLEEHSQGGAV